MMVKDSEDDIDIQLSFCGEDTKKFGECIIPYEIFSKDYNDILINDKLLRIKVDKQILNWKQGAPLLLSLLIYKKPITEIMQVHEEPKVLPIEESKVPIVIKGTNEQRHRICIESHRVELTENEIKAIPIKYGVNYISFTVKSRVQGIQTLTSRVFLWKSNAKIVVSDIDGTITKSDLLGQLIPAIFHKDYAHIGVAELYKAIEQNGYKIIYLSSRTMGLAGTTRNYIKKVDQKKFKLPDGPVFLSPGKLFEAIKLEVIQKKPETVKIPILQRILGLFPLSSKPFYGGFGNRTNDIIAYTAIGIPLDKIFIINEKGIVKNDNKTPTSYVMLTKAVNEHFPQI